MAKNLDGFGYYTKELDADVPVVLSINNREVVREVDPRQELQLCIQVLDEMKKALVRLNTQIQRATAKIEVLVDTMHVVEEGINDEDSSN